MYLRLPDMDSEVSVFDICQAHMQLEHDYNVGGILRERPSNQRRNESTGVQLSRMEFDARCRWVEIVPRFEYYMYDQDDEDVRDIYLINVLKWGLPMDDEMRAFVADRFMPDFLHKFESWRQLAKP